MSAPGLSITMLAALFPMFLGTLSCYIKKAVSLQRDHMERLCGKQETLNQMEERNIVDS